MSFIRTFIKQSTQGIASHVYEHMVADYLTSRFLQQSYMQLLDYELSAKTYDGIVVIRFETRSRALLTLFGSLLKSFSFTQQMVKVAIEQIECEYERSATIDLPKLTKSLRALQTTAWQEWKDVTITKPIEQDDARSLMTSLGGFGRKSSASFECFDITYTVENCPYELKTLAVYILQIMGLGVIDRLYTGIKYCYDSDDEWAEYQTLVGYSHKVTVRKDRHLSPTILQKYIDETYALLCTNKGIKKITRYVKHDMAQPSPYFSTESLFAKSYQVAGGAQVNTMVTARNVQIILESIKMEIIRCNTPKKKP